MSQWRRRMLRIHEAIRSRPSLLPSLLLIAVFFAMTCQESPVGPSADLAVASHISTDEHVYFLPPIAKAQSFSGSFAPSVPVEIHICEWTGDACADPEVAAFTMSTGRGSEIVRVELGEEQYIVNWHAGNFDLDPSAVYRIRVMADGDELAHADVMLAATGKDFRQIRNQGYVPLNVNGTLPIKVRIEDGAPPTVQTASAGAGPSAASLNVQHACAVTDAGAAYCWGMNSYGELGTGSTSDFEAAPVAVTGDHVFTKVVAAYLSTCGLDDAGQAWCWGYGSSGSLGNGSTPFQQPTPVAVSGGHTFTTLVAGLFHVCGLDDAGQAWCWGGNAYGALGTGSFAQATVPTQVSGSLVFTGLAAGPWTTCGVVDAGGVACWGQNMYGQLGTGSVTSSFPPGLPTPQAVVSGTGTAASATTGDYTCALLDGGDVTCWGVNALGQLGRGTSSDAELSPALVAGGHAFVTLSANGDHACALDADGTGWCWGSNGYGELGTGSATPDHEPAPVQVQGGPWASLTAGGYTTCGILTSGQAQCWGNNALGQAGVGSTSSSSIPTPTDLAGGLTFPTH